MCFCVQATAGSLQSLCWASAAVGGIASAYFSGSLVQHYGVHFVFGVTAIFPLIVSFSALLIDEQPVSQQQLPAAAGSSSSSSYSTAATPAKSHSSNGAVPVSKLNHPSQQLSERMMSQGRALWAAVSRRDILLPTVFVFLWQVCDSCNVYKRLSCSHGRPSSMLQWNPMAWPADTFSAACGGLYMCAQFCHTHAISAVPITSGKQQNDNRETEDNPPFLCCCSGHSLCRLCHVLLLYQSAAFHS